LEIEDVLFRPPGRPSRKPLARYMSFRYQAESWPKARRVVAKVEHQQGELFPRVGFIVTNMSLPSRSLARFYNKRGTAEQWNKEGKQATHWMRLSCHPFRANEVSELSVRRIDDFRGTWKDGPNYATKNLERLRAFFEFCVARDWIDRNSAKAVKPPQVDVLPTLPFTAGIDQFRTRGVAISVRRRNHREEAVCPTRPTASARSGSIACSNASKAWCAPVPHAARRSCRWAR
jgi:hypothetical protein